MLQEIHISLYLNIGNKLLILFHDKFSPLNLHIELRSNMLALRGKSNKEIHDILIGCKRITEEVDKCLKTYA